jgi:hypothetical protein
MNVSICLYATRLHVISRLWLDAGSILSLRYLHSLDAATFKE